MAFVDELKLYMKAGDGGKGVIRWRHEKNREFGGPSGGDGGKGGDVYFVGFKDFNILSKYSHKPEFIAENGEEGGSNSKEGRNGEDLEVRIPIGSILKNLETKEEIEILKEGEKILILKGGKTINRESGDFMSKHLEGKIALVTGGISGIGAAIVSHFLENKT